MWSLEPLRKPIDAAPDMSERTTDGVSAMTTFRRELLAVCMLGCASSGSERPEPGVPFGVVRRQNHRIELGELALEVDAADGGRIVEFSLKGRNVLATRS